MASRPCALRTRMPSGSSPVVKLSERCCIQQTRDSTNAFVMLVCVQIFVRKLPAARTDALSAASLCVLLHITMRDDMRGTFACATQCTQQPAALGVYV